MNPESKGLSELTQQLIDIVGTCVDFKKMNWIPLSVMQEKQVNEIKDKIRKLDEENLKDFSIKLHKEMKMEILNLSIINKGALKAKFDVNIGQWGLTIKQCTYFDNGTKRWVNLPTREYTDQDGTKKHIMLVRFNTQELQDRFSKSCLEKVDVLMQQQPVAEQASELPF